MRKAALFTMFLAAALCFAACGKSEGGASQQTQAADGTDAAGEDNKEGETGGQDGDSPGELPKANRMVEQGNPLSVKLSDIAEESGDTFNAWIKISTAFDPELSMYQSDMIPEGTKGIVVDFTVEGMDIDGTVMYWCYQITSGGESISLWDDTSGADKLTVDGNGSYRAVFDAQKALGGDIDKIESLQLVFPGISETTSTVVTVDYAGYIDGSMDLSDFVTGKSASEEEDVVEFDMDSVTKSKEVVIDGNRLLEADSTLYDGLGFISANNSSRLLLDYKQENPEAYWGILEYIFGGSGLNMSLFKLEMGSDVDSSSGTEPAVKRTEDEAADVTRGAGYRIAADALTINPDLQIDMLYWGLPAWVGAAEDEYAAVYKWYKETLDAMYDTYGIRASYLTLTRNERAVDADLIKYIARALEEETDERYDYGAIKIVAGEEVGTWGIAGKMLADGELMEAVDVVSSHYTSYTSDKVKLLQEQYGKKVWFSEGSSPMKAAALAGNREDNRSGISGLNGALDIATRITQAITEGMTMYEFQPAVSAYYDGATYFPKQLITANEPWSGAYDLDAGYYIALHFGRFIQPGWRRAQDACFGDGEPGGDGHAIVNSTYNYVTFASPDGGDYSMVIVNNSGETVKYSIDAVNMGNAPEKLYMWETADRSFFVKRGCIMPEADGENRSYELVVSPYSIVTLSTLDTEDAEYTDRAGSHRLLELPYEDDFEYGGYDSGYLTGRGMAPRYTTDQGGAFEVRAMDGGNVLLQQINYANKPVEWGSTSDPITNLGDDSWSDYYVEIDAHFADADRTVDSEYVNYVGVGARYILADSNESGYWFRLSEDGVCRIMKNRTVLAEGAVENLDTSEWHRLKISVYGRDIAACLDGEEILSCRDEANLINSGRAAIYSDYQNNYFDNLYIGTESKRYSVTRVDDMDASVKVSEGSCDSEGGGWYFNTICSYKNFNRTVSVGKEGCSFEFGFDGTALAVVGPSKDAVIKVELDGSTVEEGFACPKSAERSCPYVLGGLEEGSHSVKITVLSGELSLDALEYR